MSLIEWLIVSAIVLILGAVVYGGWQAHKSEKIVLIKSEFICTENKTERRYRPQTVNKIVIQMPYDAEICTNYKRVEP